MPPQRLRALAPAVALLLVAGAACGDDSAGTATSTTAPPDTTTTTTEATTTTSTTVAAPATSTTAASGEPDHGDEEEGLGELEALVPQLLVTAAELGPDVEDVGFVPPEEIDCTVDGDHATDVLAGTGLRLPTQVVEEVIRVYASAEAAASAFDTWVAFPPDCTFGWGAPMGAPTDAAEQVGGDRSVRYEAVAGGATVTLVVALVGDAVITTAVAGRPGLDPDEVAAFAVGKVLAALEA